MKTYLRTLFAALSMGCMLDTAAQIPVFSSNPSASAVIFLDFDGHYVQNTYWNYAGPITCNGSGLDNNEITVIFNRVAEDYRPFNVNVTTDSTKFLAAPLNKRVRVIMTISWEWYGSAGGVAFLESFTWGDDTPCFVFTSLHYHNLKNIAEAAAHEAGHTLGLQHQSVYDANCIKTNEYNYGQGSGEIGWAPIMGIGYARNLTLWNNGQSSINCSDYQNDLLVITSINGFTYRNDDHSNSFAGASIANFAGDQFNVSGIIERNTDHDYIRFTQPAYGNFHLNATPYSVGVNNLGSNLDLQVSLYNNSQVLIGVYNPGNMLNSIIDTFLNPGNYYLKVEGLGNAYAPNYASLGSYSLQGNFNVGNPLPVRRLELKGELYGDKHKLNWIIDADEQVVEQIVEISEDGMSFRDINNSATDARSFMYKPFTSGSAQYRMKVTFDNGRQYYSNIVTLRQTGVAPRPQLVSNLIDDKIAVTSPGVYQYTIFDLNGRIAGKGQLSQGVNTISSSSLTGGMYVIRFSNGNEQWNDKFLRQ